MTAQVIQLFTPARIAAHEAQINRDEWAAVGTQGDYDAQMERQRREAIAHRDAMDMAAWRAFAGWAALALVVVVVAGVM